MNNQNEDEKWIKVESRTPGYKHTVFTGTCGKDVTMEDIKNKFYHPYFGGRNAQVSNGTWRATSHDD